MQNNVGGTVSQIFPQDIFKLLIFSVFNAFFRVKYCFVCKISQIYTDLWCLIDIKVLNRH